MSPVRHLLKRLKARGVKLSVEGEQLRFRAPKGATKDFIPDIPPPYCPPADFCRMVNRIKEEALNNGLGHPLHFTFDNTAVIDKAVSIILGE